MILNCRKLLRRFNVDKIILERDFVTDLFEKRDGTEAESHIAQDLSTVVFSSYLRTRQDTLALLDTFLLFSDLNLFLIRCDKLRFQVPSNKLVRVVGLKVTREDSEPLAVGRDFQPIAFDVDIVDTHVRERPFKDLGLDRFTHGFFERLEFGPGLLWMVVEKDGSAMDGPHECSSFFWVTFEEGFVGDDEDRAEATTSC